jgi:ubiquinone/menaquinone biosynthesis C-methylase UbiE
MASRCLGRPSRRECVVHQYNSESLAAEFAGAYDRPRPQGRFFRTRLRLVQEILSNCSGGNLLDAGCGPGIIDHELLARRPDDFRITVLDQSSAMVEYCVASTRSVGTVRPTVGQLEALPFADLTFDVTLVLGALEYADARTALGEVSRVTRPGGLVIVSMLNPLSPYRLIEWFLFWPLLRVIGTVERLLLVPAERRHRACTSGIHAVSSGRLRRLLSKANLKPVDLIYYDVTMLVPPLDRLPRPTHKTGAGGQPQVATDWWRRWMGTGYLVAARRNLSWPMSLASGAGPRG